MAQRWEHSGIPQCGIQYQCSKQVEGSFSLWWICHWNWAVDGFYLNHWVKLDTQAIFILNLPTKFEGELVISGQNLLGANSTRCKTSQHDLWTSPTISGCNQITPYLQYKCTSIQSLTIEHLGKAHCKLVKLCVVLPSMCKWLDPPFLLTILCIFAECAALCSSICLPQNVNQTLV